MTGTGRFLSRSALAVAMALGTLGAASLVSAPAHAAKSKGGAPKLQLSPAFQKAIVPADAAVRKNDFEAAKAALAAAEQAISSNDDRYQFHAIELNYGIALKDPDVQLRALRGMLDTGLVPEEQIGQFSTFAR